MVELEGIIWALPFEDQFIYWLQSIGGEGSVIYYIMTFFSFLGEEMLTVLAIAIVYLGIDKKKGEKLGAMLLTVVLMIPVFKNVWSRVRPCFANENIKSFAVVHGFSFPSGHSASAASLFGGLAKIFENKKNKKILWTIGIALPILVALSRNYLGAHYLTDVIFGLLLGYVVVFLLDYCLEKFNPTRVHLVILLIGTVGFVFCRTEDYFTGFGTFLGFFVGTTLEKRYIKFSNTKIWWRVLLRVVGAVILYFGLSTLIKIPFDPILFDSSGEVLSNMITAERLFRIFRYSTVIAVIFGVFPLCFKAMDKVWLKLGFIKETDIL